MAANLDRRRITVLLAAFAAVSLGGYLTARALTKPSMIDMIVYRAEGQAVVNGTDLYAAVNVRAAAGNLLPATYPPFAALLFTPLTWVPVGLLRVLVTMADVALLAVVVHLSARLVGGRLDRPNTAARWAVIAAVTCGSLWFEPVWTTLRYGQINLALAALILDDLTRPPGGKWRGAAIGIATGVKLTPAVFIVWFLLSGRPREAAVSALSALGTAVIGFVVLPHASLDFWLRQVHDTSKVGKIYITDNQALSGVIARMLHLEKPGAAWFVVAALVGIAGLLLAARIARQGDDALGGLCCAITGLLISPISWTHHWVWAVPVVMLLAVRAPRAATAVWALAFCTFLIWAVPHGKDQELHFNALQILQSSLYSLAGLAFLLWAWTASTRAQPVTAS